MKRFISVIWLLHIFSYCESQFVDDGANLSKYWNYRYALRGDDVDPSFFRWEPGFLKVGLGPGFSLPMRTRYRVQQSNVNTAINALDLSNPNCIQMNYNEISPENNYWWKMQEDLPIERRAFNVGGPNGSFNPQNTWFGVRHGVLQWHDAPTDLGKYLMVLSTELVLLIYDAQRYNVTSLQALETRNFNLTKQIRKTYDELYMAVNAIDRLDGNSDFYWGLPMNMNGDGFYVRDDVPVDFADDGKFGRAMLLTNNYWSNTNSIYFRGNSFAMATSHWIGASLKGHCGADLQVSKDQYMKMMLGLVFARKASEGFKLIYGDPKNIFQKSFDAIDRIIWKVFPTFNINDGFNSVICKDADLTPYSVMLWYVYSEYASGNLNFPAWLYKSSAGEIALIGQKLFYTTEYPFAHGADMEFSGPNFSHEIFNYACIQGDARPMYIIPNSLYKFGVHLGKFNKKELEYQFNYLGEALRSTLYGSTPPITGWFPPNDYKTFMNRWNFCNCEHETRNWFNHSDNTFRVEEKNGLDYMLAHNLNYLQMAAYNLPLKIDVANNIPTVMPCLYYRRVEGTFPRSVTMSVKSNNLNFPPISTQSLCTYTYGTNEVPANIQAADSIDARNCHFEPNSRTILRAPHIELSPGFDARYGSVCDVQRNDRMECTPYNLLVGIGSCPPAALKVAENRVRETESVKSISIFPNPAENDVTLKMVNYDKARVDISIFNMIGREMIQFKGIEITDDEQNYNMNLEKLNTGIYIVKIKQGDYSTSLKLEKR